MSVQEVTLAPGESVTVRVRRGCDAASQTAGSCPPGYVPLSRVMEVLRSRLKLTESTTLNFPAGSLARERETARRAELSYLIDAFKEANRGTRSTV